MSSSLGRGLLVGLVLSMAAVVVPQAASANAACPYIDYDWRGLPASTAQALATQFGGSCVAETDTRYVFADPVDDDVSVYPYSVLCPDDFFPIDHRDESGERDYYNCARRYALKPVTAESQMIEEITTPLDRDLTGLSGTSGDFHTDTRGWNTGNPDVTLARVPAGVCSEYRPCATWDDPASLWSAKVTNTGTTATECLLNDSPNLVLATSDRSGLAYRYTAMVRGDSPGQTVRMRVREYSNGVRVGRQSTEVRLTSDWQALRLYYTPVAPGSALDLSLYAPDAPPGTCFYADRISGRASLTPRPNLITNWNFELDAASWNVAGSGPGVTLTHVGLDEGHPNRWDAGQVDVRNTGTAPATCTLNDAPKVPVKTEAGTYTAGLWVVPDFDGAGSSGRTLKLRLREWSGSTLLGSATAEHTLVFDQRMWHGWRHATVSYTPKAPGASTLDLNAYVRDAPPGLCFHADEATLTVDHHGP